MWWHGLVLMLTYGVYITYMLTSMKKVDNEDDDDNDVEAINVSHTVYTNAIPLRIAAKLGINCFQANGNDIYRLTDENIFAYRDFVGFKKNFERLSHEQKVSGIKKAKDRIEKRLSGEVGVDMSYSKKTAFTPPSRKRLLNKSDKIKILIAPHCFFDSPHPLGLNFYPDVFAWLEELVEISCQTDYDMIQEQGIQILNNFNVVR